jgi:alanine racemase
MSSHAASLDVDLSALAANYRLLKEKLNGRTCGAVVKANAYGLGVAEVAKALAAQGCQHFFVATLEEGIQLRGILPKHSIQVFHGVQTGEEKEFMAHDLMPVLNDLGQLERWEKVAGQSKSGAALHVDTGMTRLGLCHSEVVGLHKDVERIKRCGIKMLMSHLACANDASHAKNREQLKRFEEAYRPFAGLTASLANSSGIFLAPEFHFDVVRPGCALYGINPVLGENPMQHVATLSAPILQVRTLDRDETIGYGATAALPKGSRIAIVGMGYADGYFRLLSNKGFAYVSGRKVPIVGRVSMDMIALDVSQVPQIAAGSRAEFINASQSVNEVADACGTIGYEIFTRIGRRVARLYRPL